MQVQPLMMVAVVLLCVSAGIAEEKSYESELIEKIEVLGGTVERDERLPGRPVVRIDFQGSPRLTDKYLHILRSFKQLKVLDVAGTQISDQGLNQLAELKFLTEVELAGTNVTEFGIQRLQANSPRLRIGGESTAIEKIELLGGKIARSEKLHGGSVTGVTFNRNQRLSGKQVRLLKSFSRLMNLDLTGCDHITDAELKYVGELKNLSSLKLDRTRLTDAGLKELGELKRLTTLGLSYTQITDVGLAEVGKLRSLTSLDLSGCARLTDAGPQRLGRLTNLTTLNLRFTRLTDLGIREIANLENLNSLGLNGTQVTDAGLKELSNFKNLKTLGIARTQVTRAGVNELELAQPDLKIVR